MHCILLTLCVLIVGNKTATLTIPTGHSNIPPQHPLTNRSPFRCVTARTSKYSGTASGEREIQQGQEKERKHEDPSGHFVADSAISWVQQMLDSYKEEVGEELIERTGSEEQQAREVANLPVAICSHDFLRNPEDPIMTYGNQLALQVFGYTWEEFTSMPSRKSCEKELRDEREQLLDNVLMEKDNKDNTVRSFSAVRVSKSGEPFIIRDAVLWNVRDNQDKVVGQAVKIASTVPLSES